MKIIFKAYNLYNNLNQLLKKLIFLTPGLKNPFNNLNQLLKKNIFFISLNG